MDEDADGARETPRTLLPLLIRILLQAYNPELASPERGRGRICDVESTTLQVVCCGRVARACALARLCVTLDMCQK